jgi:hypothetical protein
MKIADDRILYYLSKDDIIYIFKYGTKSFSGSVIRIYSPNSITYNIKTDTGFITHLDTILKTEVFIEETNLPEYEEVDLYSIYLSNDELKLYIMDCAGTKRIMYLSDTDILTKRKELASSNFKLLRMKEVI